MKVQSSRPVVLPLSGARTLRNPSSLELRELRPPGLPHLVCEHLACEPAPLILRTTQHVLTPDSRTVLQVQNRPTGSEPSYRFTLELGVTSIRAYALLEEKYASTGSPNIRPDSPKVLIPQIPQYNRSVKKCHHGWQLA